MKNQSIVRLIMSALFCSIAVACSGNLGQALTTQPPAVVAPELIASQRADFDQIFDRFQNNSDLGSARSIDPTLQPEAVLPKLSHYFVIGKTLKPTTMGGFHAFLLKSLPQDVRQSLASAAYSDDANTGFALLQASFWMRAGELLDQGFQIGFVESDPKNSINGVFFGGTKTILVDAEANAGVLEHEYHHYVQYRRIARYEDVAPEFLSQDCVSEVSRYVAELDATTVEFHTWKNVFESYDADPEASRVCKDPLSPNSMKVADGQMLSLSANLSYPQNALLWVDAKVCPQELMAVLNQTANLVSVDEMNSADDLVGGLSGDRLDILADHVFINTKCEQTAAPDPYCNATKDALAADLKGVSDIKAGWENYVANEDGRRKSILRSLLSSLPEKIKKDLCYGAAGFEFLADCQNYTGALTKDED